MKIERSKIKEQTLEKELRAGQEFLLSGFESLLGLAERGSEDGAALLSEHLINILAMFLETCDKKPELFYAAAEKRSIWPALISLDPTSRARRRHYDPHWICKQVHLGERMGLKYEGKLAGSALGSQVARKLFCIIEMIMRRTSPPVEVALPKKLPKLVLEESFGKSRVEFTNRESALLRAWSRRLPVLNRTSGVLEKWWKVMKPLFVKLYGSRFEDHEDFAQYRTDIEKLSLRPNYAEKYAKDYQRRNEIRRRILKDVRQGVKSIAARKPSDLNSPKI